jgi:solute:Na+ symporter, SSS family
MNYLSVDYLIIYAFLLITLIIGLRAGRGIKDIREYAIGNRSFGTVALVLTYLATNTGIINVVDETERIGITLSISIIMGVAIGPFILALVISSKMGPFSECLTDGRYNGYSLWYV